MNYSEVKVLESLIKNELQNRFPFVATKVSTLGGENRATIFFTFSLDKPSTWLNNIMENSRYFIFSVTYKGDVDCVAKTVDEVKFKKFSTDTSSKCLTKIVKLLTDIKTKTTKKVKV
jgi:hypothetical protein